MKYQPHARKFAKTFHWIAFVDSTEQAYRVPAAGDEILLTVIKCSIATKK